MIAARQHGVVTRAQLTAAGLHRDVVDSWVRRARLFILHRGVYALGHPGVGPRGRDMAAVLAAGPGAALSHHSAAAVREIRSPWRGAVHVTATRRRALDGVVVHRVRALDPRDVATHDGIPTTRPARTLLDLADVLPRRALERAVNETQVRKLVTPDELVAVLDRSPGRRGTALLRNLLGVDGPTRSELEDRFHSFLAAYGLPPPRVNERVEGFEVDFHWPQARLIVELDGFGYHSTRGAFERDRARDAALQAAGWRVVRVTGRRLDGEPGRLASQLGRFLTPARARAPA